MTEKSTRIVLTFPKDKVDKPIVYKLIKEFDLSFNILKASITPEEEGLMVLELKGESKDVEKGVEYLKKQGVKFQPLSKDVIVNWDRCTQCGACVAQCPTGALFIADRKTMKVDFDPAKCIACELCIKPCPTRCIEVHF